jgi:hypothetical protein
MILIFSAKSESVLQKYGIGRLGDFHVAEKNVGKPLLGDYSLLMWPNGRLKNKSVNIIIHFGLFWGRNGRFAPHWPYFLPAVSRA